MYSKYVLWTVCVFTLGLWQPACIMAQTEDIEVRAYAPVPQLSPLLQETHAQAVQGDVSAQSSWGYASFCGKEMPKDEEIGVFWLEKAAKQGDVSAMVHLGRIELKDSEHKNTQSGLQWLQKAAEKDVQHASLLAHYLYFGEIYGIERDPKAALMALAPALKVQDPKALAMLAYFYLVKAQNQDITDESVNNAMELVEAILEYNIPLANTVVAWIFYEGKGTEQDLEQAFTFAQKAAQGGDAEGMALLSQLYFTGAGTEKDVQQAVEWAERAVALGSNMGRTLLGYMYIHGEGVKKDAALGYAYILLAAQHEDMAARSYVETLAEKVTEQERKQAQAQVLQWRQSWGFAK